jgi:hypothetical protein
LTQYIFPYGGVFVLLLTVVGCGQRLETKSSDHDIGGLTVPIKDPSETTIPLPGESPEEPVLPACWPVHPVETVTFLYVSDLHASYNPDPEDGISPYARIRGYVDSVRETGAPALFISGGDEFEKGSVLEDISGGRSTIQVAGAMGFDVRGLGNHDFGLGAEILSQFLRLEGTAVVATNARFNAPDLAVPGLVPYFVKQVGCVRVGFLGLVTRPYDAQNWQYDGQYLPGVVTRFDYGKALKEILPQVRLEADLIVLISHLNHEETDSALAEAPGVDLVLAGHSHSVSPVLKWSSGVPVVLVGEGARHVGHIELSFDRRPGEVSEIHYRLVEVNAGLPWSTQVQETVEDLVARYAPTLLDTIGHMASCSGRSATAEVAAYRLRDVLDVDAAFVKSTFVRRDWTPGSFALQALADAFPVARQTPGSSGNTAVVLADLVAGDFESLLRSLDANWSVALRSNLGQQVSYSVAIPRRAFQHQDTHFGLRLNWIHPTLMGELWQLLEMAARSRLSQRLFFDVEARLP